MDSFMSSYTDAPYVPSVWYSSYEPVILNQSGYQGLCALPTLIMTKESPAQVSSDKPGSAIADLVQSDDRFLDQLEVMHYLNFSDF